MGRLILSRNHSVTSSMYLKTILTYSEYLSSMNSVNLNLLPSVHSLFKIQRPRLLAANICVSLIKPVKTSLCLGLHQDPTVVVHLLVITLINVLLVNLKKLLKPENKRNAKKRKPRKRLPKKKLLVLKKKKLF